MPHTYDTIVVGTGIGGLTAGLSMQRQGHSVLLLEAGKQFGGMLNPFERKGHYFDVGVHYVGEAAPGQVLRRALDSLGLESIQFHELDPDGIERYVFDGYEARLVKGYDRFAERLAADFPREKDSIHRFMELMQGCHAMMRMSVLGPSLGDTTKALRHSRELMQLSSRPFGDLLARTFKAPELRNIFCGPGANLGLPPSRVSSLSSLLMLAHYVQGSYYPVGGGGAMRDAYVDALRAGGADLRRNCLVRRIEVLGEQRFAVHSQEDVWYARSVISNADIYETLALISGASPSRSVEEKARAAPPSLSSFCLYLVTDLDLRKAGLTDGTIWHFPSNDLEAIYRQLHAGQMPSSPYFFINSPTLKDPSHRVATGLHTLELFTLAPAAPFLPWFGKPTKKRGEEYEALKEQLTEELVDAASRYVPGLKEHLVLKDSSTPATIWHYVRGTRGAIYGPENTPEHTVARRFVPSLGIPGLYLTGASSSGPGIMACLLGGLVSAQYCARHLSKGRLPQLTFPLRAIA